MKTTILIEKKIYQRLVNEAIERHGSAKNISATLNEILQEKFAPQKSMFGKLRGVSTRNLREKHDRAV